MPITKEFKTYDQQYDILESRSLKFRSKTKAIDALRKYNYFDIINGFETILLSKSDPSKKYHDVYFEDFYGLFVFDMKLKSLILSKIFDFESRLRTSIAYHFSNEYCKNVGDIMSYTDLSNYTAPPISDTYLTKKFINFDLFKNRTFDKKGNIVKESFIETLKKDKSYIGNYDQPPFWVVIKALPMGTVYFTYVFLDQKVKDNVLKEFNLTPADSKVLEQAIFVLKELRNECAHLELVTRFRRKKIKKLNYYAEITSYSQLSKNDINLLDAIKILNLFVDIGDIKEMIAKFYIVSIFKGRKKIADKILAKMGRKDIWTWMKI